MKDNILRTVLEIPDDILLSAVGNAVLRMQDAVHKNGGSVDTELNV